MLRTMLTRRMPIKGPRTKKCAVKTCRAPFVPEKTFITWCSPECGHAIAVAKLAKAKTAQARASRKAVRDDRAETKKKLDALKPRGKIMKEAQIAFNQFIRARDQIADYSCISSGRPLDWSGNAVDAGHFRSVGSAPHLRFNEDNCHAQSKHDNQYKSGNAVDYRLGLIARIGLARVEALEADQTPRHYTIADLESIKAHYRAKLRTLKEQA